MIKEGSYIFCIKDIVHYTNGFLTFIKDKAYKIHKVEETEKGVYYYTYNEKDEEVTLNFDDKGSRFYSKGLISLAEWRALQIESILD